VPNIFADLNLISIFSTDFREKFSIRFHRNPSSGSRFDTYGETEGNGEVNRRFGGYVKVTKSL
jgi:hypothetical protein